LGIREENFIMPPTMSDNFEAECLAFERRLAERDRPDLQVLGIGMNGHIAMIQPGAPFESETWVSPLEAGDEVRIRRETGLGPETKLGGLTRGIRNIMQTRKLLLIAKGPRKADIIGQALLGPVTTDVPASVLQLHPDCEVLLDAAAGSKVRGLL
jgi:glucosamine-6-phosphate deaminase